MIAYKLFRLKGGKLFPLFINKNVETIQGMWLTAECYPTKNFAVRQGWHCCYKPIAPHLKTKLASGEVRVWVECEIADFKKYDRPESQGGAWLLAQELKVNRILSDKDVDEILNGNRRYEEALYKYCRENKIVFTYEESQALWNAYNNKGGK